MLTRRDFLASVAAMAAVAVAPPCLAVADRERREQDFDDRYAWAYDEYCAARRSGDYSAFAAGSPYRAKLARLWVELRELADPTEGEKIFFGPMETLWFEITRPDWDNF